MSYVYIPNSTTIYSIYLSSIPWLYTKSNCTMPSLHTLYAILTVYAIYIYQSIYLPSTQCMHMLHLSSRLYMAHINQSHLFQPIRLLYTLLSLPSIYTKVVQPSVGQVSIYIIYLYTHSLLYPMYMPSIPTHSYIYIYIGVCVCVCVYPCLSLEPN